MNDKGKGGLTASGLKVIACISMLIDHLTFCFIPVYDASGKIRLDYLLGRCLGRPSMLIFSFLIVESFFYTRNRWKYIIRIAILALVSEAPFDFLLNRQFNMNCLRSQNILWTFLIALLALMVIDNVKTKYFLKLNRVYYFWSVVAIVVAIVLADSAYVDYGSVGVMCVFVFYFLRGNKFGLVLGMIAWSIVALFSGHDLEIFGLIALWPINMFYRGEKGNIPKWVFYVFFPLHMTILGLIVYFLKV